MRYGVRCGWLLAVVAMAALLGGCQSTTSTSDTYDVDDFVDGSASPNPVTSTTSTGKTYRVVRGNNQPDDIYEYAYKATFSVSATINSTATTDEVDLDFPATITSTTVQIQQAAGGIVITSTSGETEHYESSLTAATGSKFTAVGSTQTMTYDVWYTLPNGGKEALATVAINFKDDSGQTFTKTITCQLK
jgi:hypothetical protein